MTIRLGSGKASAETVWAQIFLWALWAFVLAALFLNLGLGSLREWDEALTAERSREMIVQGDYWTPHLNFKPDFNKPPLYYWLTTLALRVFGIGEFSVRLWSVLFSIGCLFLVFLIGRQASGERAAGVLCLFLLAVNPDWINKTREALLDSGVLLGMLGGIYFLEKPQPKRAHSVVAGIFLAAGCLIKGPVALVALAVPLSRVFLSKDRKPAIQRLLIAFGVCLLAAGPWYALQFFRWGWEYGRQFVAYNMVERALLPIEGHSREPFFYAWQWPKSSPVSVACALFAALTAVLARKSAGVRAAIPYFILAAGWFAVINVAASKRELYLVILYPFVSLAAGVAGWPWVRRLAAARRGRSVLALAALLSVAGFVRGYNARLDTAHPLKEACEYAREHAGPDDTVLALNQSSQVVLFYTRAVRPITSSPLAALVPALAEGSDVASGARYIVISNSARAAFLAALRAAGVSGVEIAFENKRNAVVLIRRAMGENGSLDMPSAAQGAGRAEGAGDIGK